VTEPARRWVFLAGGVGLALFYLWGLHGLPAFGFYRGPYGDILNSAAVPARHVTDVVAAVNFDYRGVDTIGEEFILFTSVVGVALLLRLQRQEAMDEARDEERPRRLEQTSPAVLVLSVLLAPATVLLGLYIVTHGHLTPGGGFQGGVVLATAPLLLFLGGLYGTLHKVAPQGLVEAADAVGAGGFVVIGLAGLIVAGSFLKDFLPLGPVGAIYSSGTIPIINVSVGLEVAAGILLIVAELLKQVIEVRGDGERGEERRR
jgi:multicomponent Na+:H+ antiporter subunit B